MADGTDPCGSNKSDIASIMCNAQGLEIYGGPNNKSCSLPIKCTVQGSDHYPCGSNKNGTLSVKYNANGSEMDDERQSAYLCDRDMVIQIETAQSLAQTGWYYEHLTSKEAANLLKREPVGTFLIRDSSDSRYLYSLSVKINQGTTNVRILYLNGEFLLDSLERIRERVPKFYSAVALVDFYARLTHTGKDYNCKWTEDLSIALQRPKPHRVVNLRHLCRLSINRSVPNTVTRTEMLGYLDKLPVSKHLKTYLKEYPYIH